MSCCSSVSFLCLSRLWLWNSLSLCLPSIPQSLPTLLALHRLNGHKVIQTTGERERETDEKSCLNIRNWLSRAAGAAAHEEGRRRRGEQAKRRQEDARWTRGSLAATDARRRSTLTRKSRRKMNRKMKLLSASSPSLQPTIPVRVVSVQVSGERDGACE